MPVKTDILDTLRKIQALAERADGGEREAAQLKLDQLLRKYGLNMADVLSGQETVEEVFDLENEFERDLLLHIIGKVKNVTRVTTYKLPRSKKKVLVKATPAQMVEIRQLYSVYRKALKKGLEDYCQAFFSKNDIYPDSDAEGEGRTLTPAEREQLRRAALLLQGMKRTALPLKALKG